ncbi:hypothetical protein DPMN_051393 [Dreissena polymorpha]|uniref:Uncharacterized protein n=1 Tax=Dreissena polymorpha TaxID=45954 RepID=A0A9D4HQ80_DREPO|nr:hypothetical protein DPMN_051393 [Dreissena polymorpha]
MKKQAKPSHDKTGVVYTSSLVDVEEEFLASLHLLRSAKGQSETSEHKNPRKRLIIAETLSYKKSGQTTANVIHSCSLTLGQ